MTDADAIVPSDGPDTSEGHRSSDAPVLSDGKAPEAFRTIGEVAKLLNIRQHVLRYWEDQFPMLRPVKRSGGRRYYRPEDIALVQRIDRLVHGEGYTLRGARQAIEAEGKAARSGARAAAKAPADSGFVAATPAHPNPAHSNPARSNPAHSNIVRELGMIRDRLAAALAD